MNQPKGRRLLPFAERKPKTLYGHVEAPLGDVASISNTVITVVHLRKQRGLVVTNRAR
jgi:hypothetical protein